MPTLYNDSLYNKILKLIKASSDSSIDFNTIPVIENSTDFSIIVFYTSIEVQNTPLHVI